MTGLGTDGGQPLADGSQMEAGIHLRWQMGEDLGFPLFGFDLYRREEDLKPYTRCGRLVPTDRGGIAWDGLVGSVAPVTVIKDSAEPVQQVRGCGKESALSLPGRQSLHLGFPEPGRYVRITFDARVKEAPKANAFWRSESGQVHVGAATAVRKTGRDWVLTLFADQTDTVVLSGTDMIICELCVVLLKDGYNDDNWGTPINAPLPIYLPITNAKWPSPHAHSPDDQAEAESRLPINLPSAQQQKYAEGFANDLHAILYDLVGTFPQYQYQINESDPNSGGMLSWPGLDLLKFMALDPNIARILGLYWRDSSPDPSKYYDYRVVAHYSQTFFPATRYNYRALDSGSRLGGIFNLEGVAYTSPQPVTVKKAVWDGAELNALFINAVIPGALIAIVLPKRGEQVTLNVSAKANLTVTGYRQSQPVVTQEAPSGVQPISLFAPGGIEAMTLKTDADLAIFEITSQGAEDVLEDLVYVSFHHRVEDPPPLQAPVVDSAEVMAERTGLSPSGIAQGNTGSVALHWVLPEAGGNYLEAGAPVRYCVHRADQGNGERPNSNTTAVLLNPDAPVVVGGNRRTDESDSGRNYFIDRHLADAWYTYQLQGIDLFGRLGELSEPKTLHVLDTLPPPSPQGVAAQYLDPADPWLSPADRDWAISEGPGLKVSWEWPGMLRVQAPDIAPPAAEFRVYIVLGELNCWSGTVNATTAAGDKTVASTDLNWDGVADELVGESLRVGKNFFTVIGNSQGSGISLTVRNLSLPTLAPETGPCSMVYSQGRSYWTDYTTPSNWQQRVWVEPAVQIPVVTGLVVKVRNYTGADPAVPHGTRTVVTDQRQTDPEGVLLPGALLCDGQVYQAYGHTISGVLQVHILPHARPTDVSLEVVPAVGAAFTYYPGRKYVVFIPGWDLASETVSGTAIINVGASCADGKSYIQDNPVWAEPGRGGNSGRPGNEGPVSLPSKVLAPQRALPLAPGDVPRAMEPILARPANYYGLAKYTLTWEAVPGAAGYAVLRCSGATLFNQDQEQREDRLGYYATSEVFADDPGFSAWLAGYDSSLTEDELLTDPDSYLDAWGAWADHFYPQLTDTAVQDLADRKGNEGAFQRTNKDPALSASYTDTFDGRGQGFYVYRIRTIDAAGNLGDYSASFPPVHIFNVNPPAQPVITKISGGQKQISIRWAAHPGDSVAGYLLYRTQDPALAGDWRSMEVIKTNPQDPYTVSLGSGLPGNDFEFIDQTLVARQIYYYGVAAIGLDGNGAPLSSLLSAVKTGQAYDLNPPEPPVISTLEWVHVDQDGNVVRMDRIHS